MKCIRQCLSLLLVITIVLSFSVSVSASELPFTDVPENYVLYDAIEYAYEHGFMKGESATTFNPNGSLQRGEIVTILWRHAGRPLGYDDPGFSDVTSGRFFL